VRIVLDTNVVVSALLVGGSVPAQVLELAIGRRCTLVVDHRIVAEYRAVLERGVFPFSDALRSDFFAVVARSEWITAEPLGLRLTDPGDRPFLETAVSGAVDALVTGNVKHFRVREGRLAIPILTPRAFLERLGGS
jgi:putative PIN family toxin of toxin-antitoxin system